MNQTWEQFQKGIIIEDNYLAIVSYGNNITKDDPKFFVRLLPKPMKFDYKTGQWELMHQRYENRYTFDEMYDNESITKEECIAGIKKKYGIDITE
jgi:hypothetical protein